MSGPGAGFEYPPVEVSWLKRDVLLFANSIGCTADELHFLYVCPFHYIYFSNISKQDVGIAPKLRRLPHLPHYPPYASPPC